MILTSIKEELEAKAKEVDELKAQIREILEKMK